VSNDKKTQSSFFSSSFHSIYREH